MNTTLSLIATCEKANGIAAGGEVPWLSEHKAIHDWLKDMANHSTVIMTENMYNIFGNYVCPDARTVVVITSGPIGEHGNVIFTNTVKMALEIARRAHATDTYVLADDTLYRHMLLGNNDTYVDAIHLAIVQDLYNCDKSFPFSALPGKWSTWWKEETRDEQYNPDDPVRFVTYLRRKDA